MKLGIVVIENISVSFAATKKRTKKEKKLEL